MATLKVRVEIPFVYVCKCMVIPLIYRVEAKTVSSQSDFSCSLCTENFYYHTYYSAGYTEVLIDMLIQEYEEDPSSLKNSIQDLRDSMPAPLAASFEKPCKETAVEEYVLRFAQL